MSNQVDPKIALDIFVEKVGAFRSTLNEQEQVLLDQMVAAVSIDVMAHGVTPQYAINFQAADAAIDPAISLASAAAMEQAHIDGKDVEAHAANAKLESTWAFKVDPDGAYAVERVQNAAISTPRIGEDV